MKCKLFYSYAALQKWVRENKDKYNYKPYKKYRYAVLYEDKNKGSTLTNRSISSGNS